MTQTTPHIPADDKTFSACEVDADWNPDGDFFRKLVLTATDDMPSRVATFTTTEEGGEKLLKQLAAIYGYELIVP